MPDQPSGLGWLPDGRMLVVSMHDRKLLRVGRTATLVEHADLSGIATFHCNDMVVDAQGPRLRRQLRLRPRRVPAERGVERRAGRPTPRAKLACVDPDGTVRVAAEDLQFPNGTVITPDGRTLIVGETLGRRLTAFDVAADGRCATGACGPSSAAGAPDGICLDADGAVWVADADRARVRPRRRGRRDHRRVETDQPCFACMLGGPDRRTSSCDGGPVADGRARPAPAHPVAEVDVPGAGWP